MLRLVAFATLASALVVACGPVVPDAEAPAAPPVPDQPPPAPPAVAQPAAPRAARVVPLGEPVARLGDARLRHVAQIQGVHFRPDGKALAAAGYWSTAVIEWDVATGREVRRYGDPGRQGFLLGYAADGRRLVVCDYQRTALYDTATGRLAAEVESNRTVALSPDGRSVFGRGPDQRLTAWDAETGEVVRQYPPTPNEPPVFSPDGRWVAVAVGLHPTADPNDPGPPGPRNGLLHDFWAGPVDGSGPGRALTAPSGTGHGDAAAYWVRDDRLVTVAAGRLAAFDPATGKQLAAVDPPPTGLRVIGAAGGRLYVSRSPDGAVVGLDPDTLAEVDRGLPPSLRTDLPPLSPDRSVRAEVHGHSVRLVDAKTGEPRPAAPDHPTNPASAFQFSADGRRMYAHAYEAGRAWDVPAGPPGGATVLPVRPEEHDTCLSPDGRWVVGSAGGGSRCRLVVRDAGTGGEVFRQDPPAPWDAAHQNVIGFDPAGRVWVSGGGSVVCRVIPSGRIVQSVPMPPGAGRVVLSPDGRKLATAGWEVFAVRETDPKADWQVIETYPPRESGGCGLTRPPSPPLLGFTPDGGRLLTREGVWDTTGEPVKASEGLPASAVAFSPDGRRVVFRYAPEWPNPEGVGRPLAELRVWDVETRTDVGRVPLPAGVTAVGFGPAGRVWLAHADTTLTAHPWDWAAFDPK